MGLFGSKSGGSDAGSGGSRAVRHSSGWLQMSKYLGTDESLRILDFGPTSAGNINFITGLGHSIYMANIVDEVGKPEYLLPASDGNEAGLDIPLFMADNLDFQGRTFNAILLWDTLDYLPQPLIQPVVDRLYEVLTPGGQLLAFFHAGTAPGAIQKPSAPDETTFSRYHLTTSDQLELQRLGGRPLQHHHTNRQVEAIFHLYSGYKFFLAKDTLREVMVTR